MEFEFPVIVEKNEIPTISAGNYIEQYLKPLIKEASKTGSRKMIFRNVPDHRFTTQYAFSEECKSVDDILQAYPPTIDYTPGGWKALQTPSEFKVPTHTNIATRFKEWGYELSYIGERCFIVNWSKFIKPKVVEPQTCVIDEVKIVPQVAASSTVSIKTINDFFYSAALQALKDKGDAEIHFFHAAPGKVLCIKPPSAEFLSFTTDLILLVDQRKEMGYEVSYRYGANQEHLVVMTFPLSAAKKMIAELSI